MAFHPYGPSCDASTCFEMETFFRMSHTCSVSLRSGSEVFPWPSILLMFSQTSYSSEILADLFLRSTYRMAVPQGAPLRMAHQMRLFDRVSPKKVQQSQAGRVFQQVEVGRNDKEGR